mmetsp:Transcript_21355/g.36703  ORF Transcript_21355/g.36703 Transcript_21355/m.36703 type:complete len:175 (+) Transcript_21355:260-784(+)|eukprot:CAMPEP_0183760508 /NCGR_PEP_ID=MMETSP0739-20130205/7815_1 /TAXON_ID=385413 /ORGANISM="Thalassiosira miniscula, Strain CCMP1093" /LENGTH=174 /DNA_ID=CAMNT_0025998501 /DNA_START=188 /DNA_END=715 /DNA_ORIENTATION=+
MKTYVATTTTILLASVSASFVGSAAASVSDGKKRDRRSERRERKLDTSHIGASPCDLQGTWIPLSPICKLVSIGSSTPIGSCDVSHEIELTTDVYGTVGTLGGTKTWTDAAGSEDTVDLIGFYDEDDCSVSLVSTSTGMTITGVKQPGGVLDLSATRPSSGGKAETFTGVFQCA